MKGGWVYIMTNRTHGTLYAERHDDILAAITREKRIKEWPRAWKVRLIHRDNPDWDDLFDRLGGGV